MPTSETLLRLPDIEGLRQRTIALAALDAIMSPASNYRYYLFDASWSSDEMMATITNGSGDDLFLLFTSAGAILKGFDHESFMSPWARDIKALWKGLFQNVPKQLSSFITEPAFSIEDSTFCIWRLRGDNEWHMDTIEYPDSDGNADGSKWLLQEYIEGPQAYVDFCKDYYERVVPLDLIENFYNLRVLEKEMVQTLNSEANFEDVRSELSLMGYPVS